MNDELNMLQDDCNLDEIVDIDLDIDGEVMTEKNDKIALIDADTIAYTAALSSQEEYDLLPRGFYSDEAWEDLCNLNSFNEIEGTYKQENILVGLATAKAKIQKILDKTGCKEVYLVFSGANNFRLKVTEHLPLLEQYKANRDKSLVPEGLKELKKVLLENFPGKLTDGYEADDLVVYMKTKNYDKYILCAIDKDVINSVEGTHFNYYESLHYSKEMKWVTIDKYTALTWRYTQTLTGDKSDNVIGLHRIGIAKAAKILDGCFSHKELWEAVCAAYKKNDRAKDEALMNLNLVDMKLLQDSGTIKLRTHKELLGE